MRRAHMRARPRRMPHAAAPIMHRPCDALLTVPLLRRECIASIATTVRSVDVPWWCRSGPSVQRRMRGARGGLGTIPIGLSGSCARRCRRTRVIVPSRHHHHEVDAVLWCVLRRSAITLCCNASNCNRSRVVCACHFCACARICAHTRVIAGH